MRMSAFRRKAGRLPLLGVFILGLFGVLPLAGSAYGDATQERNVDRPGGDYRVIDVRSEPNACRYECNNDRRCRAYTYVRPGVRGPSAKCYLKTSVPAPRRNDCCVSGVKTDAPPRPPVPPPPPPGGAGMETRTDRPGGDYTNFNAPNAIECQRACDRDGRCRAFTWVRPGVRGPRPICYLKSTVPPPRANDCCVSGVKRGGPPPRPPGPPPGASLERDTDRPGSDLRVFNTSDGANACRRSCEGDRRCRAFTWVRPGVQGPTAKCYLKNAVPPARRNGCCTSGVVR